MEDPVVSLVLGFVVGIAAMSILLAVVLRKNRQAHDYEMESTRTDLIDLREELSVDKETNRHLRHQLAQAAPGYLASNAAEAGHDRDAAVSERDQMLDQLRLAQEDLQHVRDRLADRESKLREYREALKEIRLSLEASGVQSRLGTITGDVPPSTGVSAAE